MKKPWVIGLLSVVPGLGLAVLGEFRKAAGLFVLSMLTLMMGLVPSEVISITGLTLGVILWITQGYYAVVLAQRLARAEAGLALPIRQEPITPAPPGASSGERLLHDVKQTVIQLLQPDETLRVALQGATGAPSGADVVLDLASLAMGDSGSATGMEIRQVYLGLTEQHLVFVKTDAFGKPSELRRIPISRTNLVKASEGILTDGVEIDIGETEPLRISVGSAMRQGTRQLVAFLSR